jgi:hypothetical protein
MGVVVEVVKLERLHTQTELTAEVVVEVAVHLRPQVQEDLLLPDKEMTEGLQLVFHMEIGDHQAEVEQEPLVLIKLEQRQELEALDFLIP